jgi:hypothetical protein
LKRARLLVCAAAAAIAAAPSPAPEARAPRFTREQMEAMLADEPRWLFVVGTLDRAAAGPLDERARAVAERLFGHDASAVRADSTVSATEIAAHPVFLFGGPGQNRWTRRLAPHLPVRFTARGFRWMDRDYERPTDAIHLAYPHPLAPQHFLLLFAANSSAAIGRRGGFAFGGEDWRITRDGELLRSGVFAQEGGRPWRYDPGLDRDRERARERFEASLVATEGDRVRVRSPGLAAAGPTRTRGDRLLARLDTLGLHPARRTPVAVTLYRSLEEKGVVTRDTRPEHVENGAVHAALPAGRERLDLWSVAAARLVSAGAAPDSRFLEPAGAWIADRWEGEPLARAIARVHFGRVLPGAAEAATRDRVWRSPLVWVPARAVLARAVFECAGRAGPRALLALLREDPPGSLDSLCARVGVRRAVVERRYRALADSLARAGLSGPRPARPRPWRIADGFVGGVCLAHAVSLERGYLSAECAAQLDTLRAMGCEAVSLTPFGYLPSTRTPEIWPSTDGGPSGESDESVCEVTARAHARGMSVWLKPHLWTRGWVGELDFAPADWPRFFDRYRAFVLHYALLAEREGIEGLFVGHELVSASRRDPARWRALIADVRRVYSGTLTYGANWGEEVRAIPFWDALDLVSVSFYDPLATRPDARPAELEAGARRALASLREVGRRTGRPVLLSELGYAASAGAAVRPWEESRGAPDPETQRRCWEAALKALDREDWVAGVFVWKWSSSAAAGGPRDPGFTLRGKPAEAVVRRAFRHWRDRPVRAPAAR